jgi:hypothetical protein
MRRRQMHVHGRDQGSQQEKSETRQRETKTSIEERFRAADAHG